MTPSDGRGADASATSATAFTSTRSASAPRGPRSRWERRVLRARRRALRRARRVGRAVGETVTALGWAVLAATAVFLVVGYALGWVEFAVIGVTLALVVCVALVFLVGRSRFAVQLSVDRDRTVVGQSVTGRVTLAGPLRLELFGARLEVQIGADALLVRVPRSGAGGESHGDFTVPAAARGVIRVGPVRTVRGDPLGLFRREMAWTDTVDVYVHPQTVAVPRSSTGFIRDLEGNPTTDLTSSDISFHALRDYRSGDERRHIHWKSTARTGTLTVRQFEETRRSHIVIALGLAAADYESPAEFELAVSAASSLALRAIGDGRDLSMVTSPDTTLAGEPEIRRPRAVATRSRGRLLDDVSALELGSSTVRLGALARLAADSIPGISLVYLVCGSQQSLRELRSWSLRFPPGVEIVAVVCHPQQLPSLRRVAELSVLEIGYLDDLRTALARVAAT